MLDVIARIALAAARSRRSSDSVMATRQRRPPTVSHDAHSILSGARCDVAPAGRRRDPAAKLASRAPLRGALGARTREGHPRLVTAARQGIPFPIALEASPTGA